MRRKPVAVVGVAAVLLGVGVLAAGRAGAQETPQRPDVHDAAQGVEPAADRGSAVGDGSDVGSQVGDGAHGRRAVRAPQARRHRADQKHSASAGHAVHQHSKAGKPGVTIAQRPAGAVAEPHAAEPMRQKPALTKQDAGGSLVAAAQETVTAADISPNPGSPVQRRILALINQDRRRHGCAGVSLDRRLIHAANAHAADMARHDYFAHESRDGRGAGDRVTHAGYHWRHYGENIARGVNSPYAVVNGWMRSPEHRHNILDCTLDQMGIGVAVAGDRYRTIYWVQDFATPM